MNDTEEIIKTTSYLFNCKFDDPTFDADNSYEHSDKAQKLIRDYGWNTIFPYWFDYLQQCCLTENDVLNFANLFFYYGGTEQPLRDPYPFISYLYYRVDTQKYGGTASDIFDSIAIPLLSNIGEINLEKNPSYVPEKDPQIIKAIEAWKSIKK